MEEFLYNYNVIYFTYLFFILLSVTFFQKTKLKRSFDSLITILFALIVIILFGYREFYIGTDTANYLRDFRFIKYQPTLGDALNVIRQGSDPFFTTITYFFSLFFDERAYIVVLGGLFILLILLFIFKLTNENRAVLFLCFLSLYMFKYLAINVIRSGLAISLCLLAMFYYWKSRSLIKSTIFSLLAILLHISSGLFIFSMIIAKNIKNKWVIILIFAFSSLLAIRGYGLNNLPVIGEKVVLFDRMSSYVQDDRGYKIGFSWVYWFYNTIVFGASIFINLKIKDVFYTRLIGLFSILSSFYFLSFNIAFNDRIGVFSWILIPVLISYPFISIRWMRGNLQVFLAVLIAVVFQFFAIFYLNR